MRYIKDEGIVIRRRNIGEADRILTIFTKWHGKISIKAAGVRKITSRRASSIELLNHIHASLYKGKGMPVLTEVVTVDDYSSIKNDLKKVGLAYHICEIVDGLCAENQEQRFIFTQLQRILSVLAEGKVNMAQIREFELSILIHLGFYAKSKDTSTLNTNNFIEHILERRLKARQFLSKFVS
ncbi:MAG: DNA repair protein RecO [Candidatus Levybacteria bacterium]|nr:DNA repair protein RecO [Candidatus Levybacteria bacterium]